MALHRSSLHPSFKSAEHGQIQIIFGPMFSGKTTELMRRIKRYQIANYQCMVVKYANDNRYDCKNIATHDKQTLEAVSADKLLPLLDLADKMEVIGIDEGQFFTDVVAFCDQMAEKGKVVIVAALDGTFQKKGFGDILQLVPLAEHVIKLTAVCMACYNEASFTKRKGSETEVEVIGGADKYLATCRRCYRSPRKQSPGKSLTGKESPLKKSSPYKRSTKNSPLRNSPAKVAHVASSPLQDITDQTQNLCVSSVNRKLFTPN